MFVHISVCSLNRPQNSIAAIFYLLYIKCWKLTPSTCLEMEQSQASDRLEWAKGVRWGCSHTRGHRVCLCICALSCIAWWLGTRLPMLSHELTLKHTSPHTLTSSCSLLSFFLLLTHTLSASLAFPAFSHILKYYTALVRLFPSPPLFLTASFLTSKLS